MATNDATTLLEREPELSEIRRALEHAGRGAGGVILIEAPAGLGKTSLLRAAVEAADEADFLSLRARAGELERDFAYGLVRQLLEPVVARAAATERKRLFDGAASLSEPLFAPTGAPQRVASADAFSILHGLYWLLNNLADERPLLLTVDDLHWSDAESLRFLNYLAPRLDGIAVAIVASTRPGEGDVGELARLAAAPETGLVRPSPLSTEATAVLCEQRLGPDVAPEFAAACREATGGNPFYLQALLREAIDRRFATDAGAAAALRELGPPAVARAVLLRLSGRPPVATALVRAAAVLGDGATLRDAVVLAEASDEEAQPAVDLLIALAILQPAEGLEFVHSIVREAVYGEMGPHERADAHARAARMLAAGGAAEERIAAQIVEADPAGDHERVELLRRVAADALARGAPTAAVAWLRRAQAEPPPPESKGEVLLELSSAELRLGAPQSAIDQLSTATELVREPDLLATSVRLLGGALTWSGNADRAVEVMGSVIAKIEAQDRELALLLEADRAAYAQQASLEARAPVARRLEQYGDLEGATPGERLVLASLAFERARASESADAVVACAERALAGGRLLGEQELDVAGTLYLLVLGLLSTDALDLADACLERMLADAEARASIPAQAFVIVHRGWASLKRGEVALAEADARTAFELLTTYEIRLGTRFALALLIEALIEEGELDEAEQVLRDRGAGGEIPPGMASNSLIEARGLLRVAQGRAAEGVDDLTAFGRRDELWGAANPLASRWRSHASLALDAGGDNEAARRLAAEDLGRARRWGAASGISVALRASALVGDGAGRSDRLLEAAEIAARSPASLERARSLTDLGASLRRANRRTEARSSLEHGLQLAERLGARALTTRARTELLAAGGRSSDPYGAGIDQLTASERRVAQLAAEGKSNPQIAQALFITRKTVETHLGRVYRKLDISGRGDLAGLLDHQAPSATP